MPSATIIVCLIELHDMTLTQLFVERLVPRAPGFSRSSAKAEFGSSEVKEEAWKEDRDGAFAPLLTMRHLLPAGWRPANARGYRPAVRCLKRSANRFFYRYCPMRDISHHNVRGAILCPLPYPV